MLDAFDKNFSADLLEWKCPGRRAPSGFTSGHLDNGTTGGDTLASQEQMLHTANLFGGLTSTGSNANTAAADTSASSKDLSEFDFNDDVAAEVVLPPVRRKPAGRTKPKPKPKAPVQMERIMKDLFATSTTTTKKAFI